MLDIILMTIFGIALILFIAAVLMIVVVWIMDVRNQIKENKAAANTKQEVKRLAADLVNADIHPRLYQQASLGFMELDITRKVDALFVVAHHPDLDIAAEALEQLEAIEKAADREYYNQHGRFMSAHYKRTTEHQRVANMSNTADNWIRRVRADLLNLETNSKLNETLSGTDKVRLATTAAAPKKGYGHLAEEFDKRNTAALDAQVGAEAGPVRYGYGAKGDDPEEQERGFMKVSKLRSRAKKN